MKERTPARRYLREEPEWLVKPNNRLKAPTFVQLGFAEHPSTTRLGEELMEQGHNVYVNAHPKKESLRSLRRDLELAREDARRLYAKKIAAGDIDAAYLDELLLRIPPALFAEARSLIALIDDALTNREPLVVVGHSFGAQAAVVAAFLRPDLFPNGPDKHSLLILMNPAGFSGKREAAEKKATAASGRVRERHIEGAVEGLRQTLRAGALQARYIASVVGTALMRGGPGIKALWHSVRYAGAHLASGEVDREASAMANTDTVPFVNFLSEVNGVDVVLVSDTSDTAFPAQGIRARAGEFAESVELIETSGKGHFGPVHDPEGAAELVTEIVARKRAR